MGKLYIYILFCFFKKKPVWLKQQKKSKKPNSKKTTRGPKTTNAPNVTPKNGKKEETEKTKEVLEIKI